MRPTPPVLLSIYRNVLQYHFGASPRLPSSRSWHGAFPLLGRGGLPRIAIKFGDLLAEFAGECRHERHSNLQELDVQAFGCTSKLKRRPKHEGRRCRGTTLFPPAKTGAHQVRRCIGRRPRGFRQGFLRSSSAAREPCWAVCRRPGFHLTPVSKTRRIRLLFPSSLCYGQLTKSFGLYQLIYGMPQYHFMGQLRHALCCDCTLFGQDLSIWSAGLAFGGDCCKCFAYSRE